MQEKRREEGRRMASNFKLDLQIPPPVASTRPSIHFCRQLVSWPNENKITISYDDATELQAITILWVARRETEEKYKNALMGSPSLQHRSGGLSLKKSLQKFLQKRKDRIQASMPY